MAIRLLIVINLTIDSADGLTIAGFWVDFFKAVNDVVDCSVEGDKDLVVSPLDNSLSTLSGFDSINRDDKTLLGFIPVD